QRPGRRSATARRTLASGEVQIPCRCELAMICTALAPESCMEASPDLVSIGEPLVEFSRLREEDGRKWLQGFGGDTSNATIAAARQGARTGYISGVGPDMFGDAFLDLWKAEGVDTCQVQRNADAFTGVNFIRYDEAGHHFSYIRRGSAASLRRA